jgi:hypothetical protein
MAATPPITIAEIIACFERDENGKPRLTHDAAAIANDQDVTDWRTKLAQGSTTGAGAATPAPVVTTAPASGEMLSAAFTSPFKIAAGVRKQEEVTLDKNATYLIKCPPTNLGGGSINVAFRKADGTGFYNMKLRGTDTVLSVGPVVSSDKWLFTVESNGGNGTGSFDQGVSLTKVVK